MEPARKQTLNVGRGAGGGGLGASLDELLLRIRQELGGGDGEVVVEVRRGAERRLGPAHCTGLRWAGWGRWWGCGQRGAYQGSTRLAMVDLPVYSHPTKTRFTMAPARTSQVLELRLWRPLGLGLLL